MRRAVDLSAKAERERLSRPAVQAFFNIMDRWSVRDEQVDLHPKMVAVALATKPARRAPTPP